MTDEISHKAIFSDEVTRKTSTKQSPVSKDDKCLSLVSQVDSVKDKTPSQSFPTLIVTFKDKKAWQTTTMKNRYTPTVSEKKSMKLKDSV